MKMYCTFISAMEIYLLYCKTVPTEKKPPMRTSKPIVRHHLL